MTTATLHSHVQRSRFAQHALATLARLITAALRAPVATPRSPAEAAAIEAQKVRNLAYRYSKTDPGFAADLYAAAARHEGLYAD
jgi:hypothetical protein